MSIAVELWRALEAWNPDRHPRGPGGRFVSLGGGGGRKHSLADAVQGTAEGGPKRQRGGKGMSVADAVRKAARTSDSTGRPTQRSSAEHRAHGAHDVADEVDRALAEAGVSEDLRRVISGRARGRAESHGPRPGTLARASASAPAPAAAARQKATPGEIQGEIHDAVHAVQREPGAWVGLADVRDQLGSQHDRNDVDAALRDMLSQPGVRVIPVANLKALKPRDREAAVRIGGEDSHMMSIAPGTSRPSTAKATAGPAAAKPEPVGDGLDRYRTSEDQYRQHYDGYTDEQLASAGRTEGVPTEGRSRAGIVSALAAERAHQDRQTLERNLAERQAGSGAGSERTRHAGVGGNFERTEVTGAWKGRSTPALDEARAAHADTTARLADALRTTKSRDDARAAIAALNVRELRGLAGHVGAKPGSKATKAKIIDAIVEMTAGRRLDSEAISRL